MRHYIYLRLLLSGFLLYFAWPYFPQAISTTESIFWGIWLFFLILVIGGNLATLLRISKAPLMEQKNDEKQRSMME